MDAPCVLPGLRGAAGRRAALVQHEVRPEVGRDAQEGLKEASVHHEQPRRLGDHRRARARLRRPQRELAEPRVLVLGVLVGGVPRELHLPARALDRAPRAHGDLPVDEDEEARAWRRGRGEE